MPRWQSCQRRLPPCTAGCTASCHTCLERPPGRHVGGCAGAWAQSGRLPRQAPRRGRCLVGPGGLSLAGLRGTLFGLPGKLLLPGPCRLVGARGASRQVPWSTLVGLPGKLLLPGSCLLSLNTLFLDGSKGTLGDLGVRPASLCRGVLQLPVHKFGVLGYPYSSTPTGAPGPGPDTVSSAVGPGPRQGTGTRGLGHAKSCSVSTALSHNGTR